ncbi:hypothetical protein MMC07_005890 [Pseudocyphellaria aurata]|nr:hypothetical protein [Pseudocyphellaria aurata]
MTKKQTPEMKQSRGGSKRRAEQERIQEEEKEARERVELFNQMEAEEAQMRKEKELHIRAYRLPTERVVLRQMIRSKRNGQRRTENDAHELKRSQSNENANNHSRKS